MKKLFLGLIAILSLSAYADKLIMKDGSVLVGQIGQIFEGKIDITTAFAGNLSISQGDVAAIETDAPVNVADQEKKVSTGTFKVGEDGAQLLSIEGSENPFATTDINAVWTLGSRDLTLPPPRQWSGEVYADMNGKTGNTEKFNGGTGVRAVLAGPVDKFLAYASASYDRENHVTSTKKYLGGLDFERQIAGTNNNWYSKAEFEQEKTNNLKLRSEFSLGYGRYLLKKPGMELRFRIGAMYQKKEYTNHGGKDDNYGMELALHFEKKIQDWSKLISDITYTPSFNDINNYRFVHESSLDIPIIRQIPLSLRLGIKNEYNNPTPGDVKHLDTTYFTKLVYRW